MFLVGFWTAGCLPLILAGSADAALAFSTSGAGTVLVHVANWTLSRWSASSRATWQSTHPSGNASSAVMPRIVQEAGSCARAATIQAPAAVSAVARATTFHVFDIEDLPPSLYARSVTVRAVRLVPATVDGRTAGPQPDRVTWDTLTDGPEEELMSGAAMIPEFDHEMASTRKMLDRVPDERLDFRPHEKSWTLRELAGHVANLPNWIAPTLQTSEFDLSTPFDQPNPQSRDDLLALFDSAVAAARPALQAATSGTLGAPWTLRTGDQVHFTMPKAAVVRFFVMNHLVHHRGQLGLYLRMLNVPVPGMYGPTADEAM